MDEDTGTPPQSGVDVLSRWHWLDRPTIESIANGTFDIYSLPKLHQEEHLRFRHTTKSTEDLFMAINGTQFEHVIGRTRMQSAFPQIISFLTAWQVYTTIRISFNTERARTSTIGPNDSSYAPTITLDYQFSTMPSHTSRNTRMRPRISDSIPMSN